MFTTEAGGAAGLLLAFAYDCAIEAIVYNANSGRDSWQPRTGVPTWPALFGQAHEVNHMLATIGVNSPADFIGAVTSTDAFAARIKDMIVRTSDHMASKQLKRSVRLPAWLVILSKDGSVSIPRKL